MHRPVARIARAFALAGAIIGGAPSARADDHLVVAVRHGPERAGRALGSIVPARLAVSGGVVTIRDGADRLRVMRDDTPRGTAPRGGRPRFELEGARPGHAALKVDGGDVGVAVLEARLVDGDGREVDPSTSHASLQRTPPERLGDDPFGPTGDPDALRVVVAGALDDLPGTVAIVSLGPTGAVVDRLVGIALGEVPCPPGAPAGVVCGSTHALRAVADDIDRRHPLVAGRSVKAELGGALVITTDAGDPLEAVRVGGPRTTALGPIERYRARLRVTLVRARPDGPPPIGGDDAAAQRLAREEVRRANALWGACGVTFGPPEEVDVRVVDPPIPSLVALGCDRGLPASGGSVRVRVDGREVAVRTTRGQTPAEAARALAGALRAAGFSPRVIDSPRIGPGALATSDVLVRRASGAPALVEAPRPAVGADATLGVCVGVVDLEDGLQHFSDVDAVAGTLEERALLAAIDDGDPTTIDVVMVPAFAGGGRIGESFITGDAGALQNVVLLDRASIRADRASFALAHELGHVLLDEPGHTDDFGVDTPTRLMDADATNGTAFGPRRLTVGECVRAVRQSGPGAPTPLLSPWPLGPLGEERAPPRGRRARPR